MQHNQTNRSAKIRFWFIEITTALLVLVFLYTGIVKLKDHDGFIGQMQANPLLNPFREYISWIVPVSELAIAGLLIIPRMRKKGLLYAAMLMAIFTLYIAYMLATASKLPCTCGGIISKMSWRGHFWFNSSLTIMAFLSYHYYQKDCVAINRSRRTPDNIVGTHPSNKN